MKAVAAHQRRLAGLARSVRAAIVVPSIFALSLIAIKQPEMAGFAVFGTFAQQVLVNYDSAGTARYAQSAMLTIFGAAIISVGVLASTSAWVAVGGAATVGFLSELPSIGRWRLAPLRTALLLAFMLAVATPAHGHAVFLYLAGWLLAGAIAQPALLLIWTRSQKSSASDEGMRTDDRAGSEVASADRSDSTMNALRSGLALGLAILLTRLIGVEHAFWVVLGVLPVLNASGSPAARKFWQEQAGTFIGFSVSAVVVAILGPHLIWYWYWSILPFVVFASAYAASTSGLLAGQAAFTLFAVVLFGIVLPQQKQTGRLRLEDIAIGGTISVAVGALIRRRDGASLGRLENAANT
jgi:hypothetical protein